MSPADAANEHDAHPHERQGARSDASTVGEVEVRLEVEAGPVVLLDFEPLEGYAPTDDFDGIETLASDAGGVLVHRAESQPERVTVVTPGWELVQRTSYFGAGTVQGDSGRFTVEDGELTVQVRPSGR